MLIAFPVLPLLASTMVSPGRSSPSRSARSIMYRAMRALMDPDGLRYSSLTHIPSTMISGVLPIASRIVPPPGRTSPAACSQAPCSAAAGSRASRAAERAPLVPLMPAAYVRAAPRSALAGPESAPQLHELARHTDPAVNEHVAVTSASQLPSARPKPIAEASSPV